MKAITKLMHGYDISIHFCNYPNGRRRYRAESRVYGTGKLWGCVWASTIDRALEKLLREHGVAAKVRL